MQDKTKEALKQALKTERAKLNIDQARLRGVEEEYLRAKAAYDALKAKVDSHRASVEAIMSDVEN